MLTLLFPSSFISHAISSPNLQWLLPSEEQWNSNHPSSLLQPARIRISEKWSNLDLKRRLHASVSRIVLELFPITLRYVSNSSLIDSIYLSFFFDFPNPLNPPSISRSNRMHSTLSSYQLCWTNSRISLYSLWTNLSSLLMSSMYLTFPRKHSHTPY